jgi:signal recognition particle receptor subunit beta
MVLFNYATKEITAKIVYYGPGLCGKTTNLQFVYDSLPSNNKSKMLSLATKTDRTLFFDFLPLDLGKIRGMRTKLQLYTVPGQVYYNSTRQLVLKGADGIVFVADSQDFALDANLESLQNLEDNLKRQGIRLREMPLVLQYNKRDLSNKLSVAEIDKDLNKLQSPTFESVATTGLGVEETLKGITQLVLAHLVKKYGLEGSGPLDKEIQILNAPTQSTTPAESLWDDEEDPFSSTVVAPPPPKAAPAPARASQTSASPSRPSGVQSVATPAVAAPASAPLSSRATPPPPAPRPAPAPPAGEAEFELDDDADESIPLIATELVGGQPAAASSNPFDDVSDYFNTFGRSTLMDGASPNDATEVPTTSIEIPLPPGILDSLPILGEGVPATTSAPERRSTDGLVREVTIPLNLSVEEIRQHRRLRLKITLDVNLLP